MKLCILATITLPASALAACADARTIPGDQETVAASAQAGERATTVDVPTRRPDVVYVPTPEPVVDAMLKLARVQQGDVLYDLGSGDGRIPVTAARDYGVRAVGIDIDPQRIAEAQANVRQAGVEDLVTITQGDLFELDISEASVVTLYLLDSLNQKLRPKLLRELEPGTRIVSHAFAMGDWKPEAEQRIDGSMIYLWTVPPRQ